MHVPLARRRIDPKVADALDSIPKDLETISVVPWLGELLSHGAPHDWCGSSIQEDYFFKNLDERWCGEMVDALAES